MSDDELSTTDNLETNEEDNDKEDNQPIIFDNSHSGTHHKVHNLDVSYNGEDQGDNKGDKHVNTLTQYNDDEQSIYENENDVNV